MPKKTCAVKKRTNIFRFLKAKETLDRIEELARLNLSYMEISARLGVSAQTLKTARDDDGGAIDDAITRGRAKGVDMASTKLMDLVQDGNLNAIKFYLTNVSKEQWSDGRQVQASVQSGDVKVNFNISSPNTDTDD